MRLRQLLRSLGLVGLMVAATTAGAANGPPPDAYLYRSLIDRDSNDSTGCDVAAHDDNFAGPVHGIEFIVTAVVYRFPTYANVVNVGVQRCDSGMDFFPSDSFDNSIWPVSLETGVGGADVVEFYVPRAKIGNPDSMTLGFHATRGGSIVNDVLLTKNGTAGGDDIVFDLGGVSAPLLSPAAIFACIVLFAGLAVWSLRRQRPQVVAVLLVAGAVTAATTGWAVTIMLDGMLGDWDGVPQIAQDVLDDSTADDPAEDIVVAYVTADAQNVYFRMDQVNLCPVQCGNGVLESGEECEVPDHCEAENESPEGGSGAFAPTCLCTSCTCSPGCFDERVSG